jgi:hypothetical protein
LAEKLDLPVGFLDDVLGLERAARVARAGPDGALGIAISLVEGETARGLISRGSMSDRWIRPLSGRSRSGAAAWAAKDSN